MADSFYLEPDDSKSLGDIDYMRTVKRVRRTYAKYKSGAQGGQKITKSVSATDDTVTADPQYSTGSSFTQSSFSQPSSSSSSESTTASSNGSSSSSSSSSSAPRVNTDTSMDMFRNMAKKLKR